MWQLLLFCFFPSALEAREQRDDLLRALLSRVHFLLLPAPQDQEVCFSPEQACGLKYLKFLELSRVSLDIAAFDLTYEPMLDTLAQKRKEGVVIRLLVDPRQSKGTHSQVPRLIEEGFQVRFGRQKGVMHHKFTILDHKKVQTGSFNYTRSAHSANQENQIYLENMKVVEDFEKQFEESWRRARAPRDAHP